MREDAQRDQRRDALPVGGISQAVAGVVRPMGSTHSGRRAGRLPSSRRRARMRCDGLRHLAAVKASPRFAGDQPERARRAGKRNSSPTSGARPFGGRPRRSRVGRSGSGSAAAIAHFCRTTTGHGIAALGDFDGGFEQVGEGQRAEAPDSSATQADTARHGDAVPAALKRHARIVSALGAEVLRRPARGATPLAFRPCSLVPSHRIAKASEPRPLLQGSTMVIAAAAAIAASTALPPFHSMRQPACAASGCEVETMLRPNTGTRWLG